MQNLEPDRIVHHWCEGRITEQEAIYALIDCVASSNATDVIDAIPQDWVARLYSFVDAAPTDWTGVRLVSTDTFSRSVSSEELDEIVKRRTNSYRSGVEAIRAFRKANK